MPLPRWRRPSLSWGATEIMDLSEIENLAADGSVDESSDAEADSQIAEINVLIAYAQFDKALEMAKSLVETQPDNVSNRLKLMEVIRCDA